MTGFGRSQADGPLGQFTVEIRSVNNRFLDVGIALPRELAMLETPLRALLKSRLARGKVDARARFVPCVDGPAGGVRLNEALAARYVAELRKLAAFGTTQEVPIALVAGMPGVLESAGGDADEESRWATLRAVVEPAIDALDAERLREGEAIGRQLADLSGELRVALDALEGGRDGIVEKFRERLLARVAELMGEGRDRLDPGRLELEVALYADRADISEEIVRLRAHMERYDQLLAAPADEPVGKNLDFLVQELNREINTVCSKTRDSDQTALGLAMKGIVERIREQVQNVE
jgi:uncharacterized protein (TIGR00255 family)